MQVTAADPYVLLIDFCGSEPFLALVRGGALAGAEVLPERGAAAGWLPALRHLLEAQNLQLSELAGVGVVAGPGSFTGVRTGLSAAQGLCEAAGLPLAAVSRLAVLAHAAENTHAVAVLHAGRGQVYVRTPSEGAANTAEVLADITELESIVRGRPVVITEPQLAPSLATLRPCLLQLGPLQILPLVQQELLQPAEALNSDANYVRSESQIYRKPAATPAAGTP